MAANSSSRGARTLLSRRACLPLTLERRGISMPKRKITVAIDAELVAEMELVDEPISAQVNRAVSESISLRRQHRLLREMLDSFDAELGPVDDQLVQKYRELLA